MNPNKQERELASASSQQESQTLQRLREEILELRKIERLHNDLYENSPDMCVSVGVESRLVEKCNQTLINAIGRPRDQIVGSSVFDIFHPDCEDEAKALFAQLRKQGAASDKELVLQRQDGTSIPVVQNFSMVVDEDGTPLFSQLVWRDITGLVAVRQELARVNAEQEKRVEQRTAELKANVKAIASKAEALRIANENLAESDARFRGIFNQTFQFIGIMSPDGTLVNANRTSLKAAGISPEEVLGKKFWDTAWWQHSNELQTRLREAVKKAATGTFDRFEATHPTADGSILNVDFSLKPVKDETGKVVFLIPEGRDVTEMHQAKLKMQEYAKELEKRNQDLDEFAYVASHDLSSPIRAVANLADWIVEDAGDSLPEQCQENLRLMQSRIGRMQMLLTDLLTYSRAGRQMGDVREISVQEMVSRVTELIHIPDGFLIDTQIEPADLRIKTWLTPLQQCLQNLVSNAIKHHDQGSTGRVKISVTGLGETILFEITDNGPGIPREHHEKIFDMFKTLKSRDDLEASGMGLAIVKRITESIGGEIGLTSEPGVGTTFRLTWNKTTEL
ncbi:MAG: PAS domain S-box protein [Mariniblastus sp.]